MSSKLLGIILLVVGVILLIFGWNASQSLGDQVTEKINFKMPSTHKSGNGNYAKSTTRKAVKM